MERFSVSRVIVLDFMACGFYLFGFLALIKLQQKRATERKRKRERNRESETYSEVEKEKHFWQQVVERQS